MKLSTKQQKGVLQVHDAYWTEYLKGNVKAMEALLDDSYTQVGSAESEVFSNKKEAVQFLYETIDEVAGKLEMRNRNTRLEQQDGVILVHERCDLYALDGDKWVFYSRFRATTFLQERKTGWKFIHQHSSFPDSKTEEGQNVAIDRIAEENRELREAVKRRTTELEQTNRELEIEAALEKVRSRTMAMQSSGELPEAANLLFLEILALGIPAWSCGYNILADDKKSATCWMSSEGALQKPFTLRLFGEASFEEMGDFLRSKDTFLVQELAGKALIEHYDHMKSFPDLLPTFEDLEAKGLSLPTFQINHLCKFSQGFLLFITYEPVPEAHDIFKRFNSVFEQTYTRFLDLQKAEAQAREAQIEVALERVRARTMAMQRSEELSITNTLVVEQINLLINSLYAVGIHICRSDKPISDAWIGDPVEGQMPYLVFDHSRDPFSKRIYREWKIGNPFHYETLEGKDLDVHFRFMATQIPNRETFDPKIYPSKLTYHLANFSKGFLIFVTTEECPQEHDIFKRFAKVFEQTYTRFLDIQKAEAQAREAQIEAALEKVRSRTMAMHKSEELAETALVLYEQFKALGNIPDRMSIGIFKEETKEIELWPTDQFGSQLNQRFRGFWKQSAVWTSFYKAWKSGDDSFVVDLSGQKLKTWLKFIREEIKLFVDDSNIKGRRVQQAAFFSHGMLLFTTNEPVTEEIMQLLVRFSKVFSQTYTRFLDLQKAEAQTREAQIEAALERVRSRSMAMHKSEELAELSLELVKQVQTLGVATWFCAFNIYDDDPKGSLEWGSNGQGTFPKYRTPREGVFLRYYEAGKRGETLLINEIGEDECPAHYEYLCTLPGVGEQLLKMKDAGIPFPVSQIDHVAFFKYGYVLFITYEPSPESHEIFIRFAKVFEQTYTRFLDLKKAEAQAREAQIENALEKVRSRTMAMQKSTELGEAANNLFLQVQALGIPAWGAGYCIWETEDMKTASCSMSSEGEFQKSFSLPTIGEGYNFYDPAIKGESFYVKELGGKALEKHYEFMRTLPTVGESLDVLLNAGLSLPTFQIFHIVFFTHGYLMFITYEPVPEAHDIFKRFGNVFKQTYTRFLDLQKAEAQLREGQIEAALEKVRSQSLAMHSTSEMQQVANAVFEQLRNLGLGMDVVAMSGVIEAKNDYDVWIGGSSFDKPVRIPFNDATQVQRDYNKAIEGRPELFVSTYSGDIKKEYINHLLDHGSFPDDLKKLMIESDAFTTSISFAKNSAIQIARYNGVHYSDVENEILKRFARVFEQAYIRFLDLQKAEAQAREAQIERGPQKVRSVSLAMHQSKDLHNVLVMLYNQLDALGLKMHSAQIIESIDDFKEMHLWVVTNGVVYPEQVHAPFSKNIFFKRFREAVTNGESFYTLKLSKRQKDNLFHHFFDNTILRNAPQARKDLIFSSPGLGTSNAIGKYTSLSIMRYDGILYSDEENEIIKRFLKVFEQSYTRFLDLQKAESQAREAQIEGALERVRSKAMAMHSSDDLADTVEILYKELDTLQVHALRFGHAKVNWDTKIVELHTATDLGKVAGQLKLEGHPLLEKIYEHYLAKEDLYYALQGEEMKSYYSILGRAIDVPIPPMDTVQHGYFFFLGDTANYAWSDKVLDEEELKVYRRLITVLNLTYKRYEELKNAETQAREAQIEGALERVRTKTMAMHNSEDLEDIVISLFDEVMNLGLDKSIRCGIGILEGHEGMETRSVNKSSDGTLKLRTGMLNMTIHPMLVGLKKAWKNGSTEYSYDYTAKDVRKYYEALNNEPEYPFNANLEALPEQEFHRSFFYSSGILFAFSENPISEESSKVLARFAAVFGQTYRRFLDLQEAEDRAKDAVKQASLDRVRGEIASMRSTADLQRITPLVWNELTALEIPFIRCGVFIINESDKTVQAFLSAPDGHSLGAMRIPYDADKTTASTVAHWKKKEVYKTHWDKGQFLEFMQLMIDLGQVSNKSEYQGAEQPPESLHLHFVPFTQGMLYVGNVESLEGDQIEMVQSLADSFAIAYARYEDFVRLEKAKKQVENTLEELKSTQNQLVQSEKMASLGELTAGIAHEIKNPLNFVNNFSEVSVELLEELQEEMKKGDMEEVNALIEDIQQNLGKINHHGQRADGIVKGMLQHSRAGSGEKELTDLNVLADEYLRLAYHGLRAKDKSFNATLETHFDQSIGKVNVLTQDMGRVILNLITNAFYVVQKKKEQQPEGYEPTVTVTTRKEGNKVLITVKDNGNGIPDAIKEKIFQPFFTTKPTGQGTGLGLSMSYDIVTKGHGGELKVETKENEGSAFNIYLPL